MSKKLTIKDQTQGILNLLAKDLIAAEQEFNKLDIVNQAEVFINAKDFDRLKLLEIAYKPRELLENVPTAELWYTVNRLTPRDAIPIIQYAAPNQLQVMTDIECWGKDRINNESMYEWLEYIIECGLDRLVEWFQTTDWDQLVWFFRENIIVCKQLNPDENPACFDIWPRNDDAPITHEGLYYFQVKDVKHDQVVRYVMEMLAKSDLALYHDICESCLWDLSSSREEAAYEMRIRRLEEEGFPSFDDAIAVYAPLSRKKFAGIKKRTSACSPLVYPRYPLTVLGDKILFLNRVLSPCLDKTEESFLFEIAALANKLVVGDAENITFENSKQKLLKAIGYTNIGLEVLSDGDLEKGTEILSNYYVVNIFQVGLAEVIKRSERAKKIFNDSWIKGCDDRLELLQDEDRLMFENLILKRPLYFRGGDEFDENCLWDFLSLENLMEVDKNISRVHDIGEIVGKVTDIGKIITTVDFPSQLKFTGVLMTLVINGIINQNWSFKVLTVKDLENYLKIVNLSESKEFLESHFEELRKNLVGMKNLYSDQEAKALDKYLEASKQRFIEDFSGISGDINPAFVLCVWLSSINN